MARTPYRLLRKQIAEKGRVVLATLRQRTHSRIHLFKRVFLGTPDVRLLFVRYTSDWYAEGAD